MPRVRIIHQYWRLDDPKTTGFKGIVYTQETIRGGITMKNTSILASLAGLVVIGLSFGAIAQDDAAEAPKPLSDVWLMVVKPGMDAEFAEAMVAHMQFRKHAG